MRTHPRQVDSLLTQIVHVECPCIDPNFDFPQLYV